jgi:uncharacterized protein (TIGR00661 family)
MKIFYAVQATGNGHISRAMEILPYLKQYGEVDIFLSGSNSSLPVETEIKYRSRGVCFFYNYCGSIGYARTLKQLAPLRVFREARDLPVHQYDIVINDFEFITSLACSMRRIPSINFGHHASFRSDKVPRPEKKEVFGEWILANFGRASSYIGLHFESYDDFILPPVIRKTVRRAEPVDNGHITVYLPAYSDEELEKRFGGTDCSFQVFSRSLKQPLKKGNILFLPVSRDGFTKSMSDSHAVICGAGFETPAEALYLGKKLMVIPVKGQYEQKCNAAALEKMGITVLNSLNDRFGPEFYRWMNKAEVIKLRPDHSTRAIVSYLMHSTHALPGTGLDLLYPEWVIG